MTHTAGHDEETPHNQNDQKVDGRTLEAGNIKELVKKPLVELGTSLRAEAQNPRSRVHTANKVLSKLPPEEQRAFIENSKTWYEKFKRAAKDGLTGGLYSLWQLIGPSLTETDMANLDTFHPAELKIYLALGIIDTEESVAQLIDSELKENTAFLKFLALIATIIPGIGPEVAKLLMEVSHMTELPAELAIDILPGVRNEVRAKSVIPAALATEYGAIANGLEPEVELAA